MTPAEALRLTLAELCAEHASEPTVWVRRDAAELPAAPTTLTWAALGALLGASGGTGRMLADLGAPPDPTLSDAGAFDLVAGRPMLNLARAARMRGVEVRFRYPVEAYRTNPGLALAGEPAVESPRGVFGLPRAAWRLYRMNAAPRAVLPTFAGPFLASTLPGFLGAARSALGEGVAGLTAEQLVARFAEWQRLTFNEFGREALKPAALARAAGRSLAGLLAPKLGGARAAAAVAELGVDAPPPAGHDWPGDRAKLTRGELGVGALLARHGHRATDDLELGCPRYAERPDLLPPHPNLPEDFADLAARLERLGVAAVGREADPDRFARVSAEAGLGDSYRERLARAARLMRTHLGLHVAARGGLAAGVAVMRQSLLGLGAATGLGEAVFDLLPGELPLPASQAGALADRAEARRRRRVADAALVVPDVLFGDDLGAIAVR